MFGINLFNDCTFTEKEYILYSTSKLGIKSIFNQKNNNNSNIENQIRNKVSDKDKVIGFSMKNKDSKKNQIISKNRNLYKNETISEINIKEKEFNLNSLIDRNLESIKNQSNLLSSLKEKKSYESSVQLKVFDDVSGVYRTVLDDSKTGLKVEKGDTLQIILFTEKLEDLGFKAVNTEEYKAYVSTLVKGKLTKNKNLKVLHFDSNEYQIIVDTGNLEAGKEYYFNFDWEFNGIRKTIREKFIVVKDLIRR